MSYSSPIPFPTLTYALSHWAAATPTALALTSSATELTYAELAARVERCVGRIIDEGVEKGDRVVIVGHNTIEWVVNYLSVLSAGAVVVPANNRLNPTQFADQVETLDATLILTDADHRHITSEVQRAPVKDLDSQIPEAGSATPLTPPDPDSLALISFTSGTTGRPKGAMLTQRALVEASWAFIGSLATTGADSTLIVVPMFHNTGFIDQFGHMLLLGGRTDLLRRFRTKDAISALQNRPVSYLAAVPSIHRLLMLADGAEGAFGSIRVLLYGGSPMPSAWIEELHTRWPHMQLFHGYGMTEYGSAVSFLPAEYAASKGESVGFAVPGTAIRIVDGHGQDVEPGSVGEMWVKGPTMMIGYWQQPELSAAKIQDGWLRTGDLAREEDGFYYIEGRVDDVINRGGEKVLPTHIEGLLSTMDSVADSCVFGVPDPILQNRIWAAIEERREHVFDEAALKAALTDRLPDYAVPERISVMSSLPRGASGKVDRRAVASYFMSRPVEDNSSRGD